MPNIVLFVIEIIYGPSGSAAKGRKAEAVAAAGRMIVCVVRGVWIECAVDVV